jgi:tetratricopeptide (TPR) repeat protein
MRNPRVLVCSVTAVFVAIAGFVPAVGAHPQPLQEQQVTDDPPPPPPDPAVTALKMLSGWQRGDAERILDEMPTEEQPNPDFQMTPEITMVQGLHKALEQKYEDSLSLLNRVDATSKANPAPAYFRGEVYLMQRDMKKAQAEWNQALQRATELTTVDPKAEDPPPVDPVAMYYRGATEVRLRQFKAAREHLVEALEAGAVPAAVQYQIGLSYSFEQKWKEAQNAFDAAIEADGLFAMAYYYRALVWDKLKRKDKMFVDLDQFVKLAPDAPEADRAKAVLATAKR